MSRLEDLDVDAYEARVRARRIIWGLISFALVVAVAILRASL